MSTEPLERHQSPEQKTFIVVLRARSSARFKPEEGQEISFSGLPGILGQLRLRLRTRWVDEGFEAPTPRELWIEAVGPALSLDDAVSNASAAGRFLATLLAFCANTAVETPEVHIAYDASEGSTEREFMEVFPPDEGGHPREGRLARPNEFTEVFRKLDSSDETARITRAIQQYDEALRHWYFGGEWLSLSHLYMAVEALTEVAIERECADRGIDQRELARQNGIDPDDPERPRWKPALEAWCRAAVIFNSDTETYNAVKSASDGLEHGFMELSDVHRNAMIATDATFGYVRRSILWLLNISSEDFPDLVDRIPRDIQSFRKIIRGHFVGNGDDPAPPGEPYPRLEWHSSIKALRRDGDTFSLSFQEKFTVRCAPGYGFKGVGIEARGRKEPGQEPVQLDAAVDVSVQPEEDASASDALSLMPRANKFASDTDALGRTQGMALPKTIVFGLFSEQVALFEAIETLLRAHQPVEALIPLRSLIVGTCRLESILTDPDNYDGAALRLKLDATDRVMTLYADDSEFVHHLQEQVEDYRRKAAELVLQP